MGNTKDGTGALKANNASGVPGTTVADFQAGYDRIEEIGGLMNPGTRAARLQLTAGQTKPGWLYPESDTGALMLRAADGWQPVNRTVLNRFSRPVANDATVAEGSSVGLIDGTITNALAGVYLVVARASLYSTGGPVVGWMYAEAQTAGASAAREEARWDLPAIGSYPTSPTVQFAHVHGGGDLRVTAGYRRASGTFAVTGQGSGETVVTATYIGRVS